LSFLPSESILKSNYVRITTWSSLIAGAAQDPILKVAVLGYASILEFSSVPNSDFRSILKGYLLRLSCVLGFQKVEIALQKLRIYRETEKQDGVAIVGKRESEM
jgi:hypothetical protein